MTIGLDLSSLQGPHRMRGIGYTLLNFINNISAADREKHAFVFYAYPSSDEKSPLNILNLEGMNYEIRELKHRRKITKQLPGRLNLFVSALNQLIELKDLYFGDSRIKDLSGVNFFLQTDQSQHLPRRKWGLRKGLVIYDIIPYVLEWEYLWNYATARQRGFSRKAALRVHARRWLYGHKIKVNTRRAKTLFSISEHTKQDFVNYLGTASKKIVVTPLGVNVTMDHSKENTSLKHYVKTSWGYVRRALTLDPDTHFVLYVGGADRRRRLDDLVSAFNILRAQGHDFKLLLAGDSMQGPENISTEEIQYAFKMSSYKEDVIFMGFIDDTTRDWLYSHARAFVFPSRYEGFGLPVLEAMSYGTPVISYKNAATIEVAGDAPVYVDGLEGLVDSLRSLLSLSQTKIDDLHKKSLAQAKKYESVKTSQRMLDIISSR